MTKDRTYKPRPGKRKETGIYTTVPPRSMVMKPKKISIEDASDLLGRDIRADLESMGDETS